jgi:hypothetical protein
VLLRAMAKRPDERFSSVQEFASAFCAALAEQPRTSSLGISANRGGLLSGANERKKGGLFDARWQAGSGGALPAATTAQGQFNAAASPQADAAASFAAQAETPALPAGTGLLSKTGLFPRTGLNEPTGTLANPTGDQTYPTMTTGTFASDQTLGDTLKRPAFTNFQANASAPMASTGQQAFSSFQANGVAQQAPSGQASFANFQADVTGQQTFGGFPTNGVAQPTPPGLQSSFFAPSTGALQQPFPTGNLQQVSPSAQNTTSALALLNAEPQSNNTVKLTGAVKVVQVPVGGGQYVTGYLPMQKETPDLAEAPRKRVSTRQKAMLVAALCVLLIGSISGVIALTHSHSGSSNTPIANVPDRAATAAVQASATAQANTLFQDSLSQNTHNFPPPNAQQFFKDGAYHLYVPGSKDTIQLVQQKFPQTTLSYQITMEEIKGNDNSATNDFGVVLDCNVQYSGSLVITTFYTFEILNQNGHFAYEFYKYNSNFNSAKQPTPYTSLGKLSTPGKEFHGGQGPNAINTVRIVNNAGAFTFYVNNQQVGTAQDTSLQPGYLGMLVNNTGTEVAYSNMLVTLK